MKTTYKQALRAMLDFDDQGVEEVTSKEVAVAIVGREDVSRYQIDRAYAALSQLTHRGYLTEIQERAEGVRRWRLR